ncbi:MAG: OmpA family protein [Zetaproteobacteria bacterium]|nr:OmpA family protein [Zetaproteobacteria bacterium]
MLQSTKRVLCIASLAFLVLGVTQCSDSPATEETIVTEPSEIPAEPGDAGLDSAAQATTIYFAFDSHVVTMEGQSVLEAMAAQLKSSGASIQIEGHCDMRGSIEYNLALGQRRADAVKDVLVQLGVDAAKVSTISYGKEKPAMSGDSEEAHAKNRRAEFNLI